ncbi:MAG: ATP-binding protein, partial [Desulfobacterales bacterium]|nr:ATP-binding protein [Desulfobacterales bacterium]
MKPDNNKPPNPYPGLRPFESDEDYLFFGREGQANDLLMRLRRFRFAAVVGSSGCGKSSLVKAGLIPALHGGGMAGPGKSWRTALFRPGHNPLHQMAMALNRSGVPGEPCDKDDDEFLRIAIAEAALRRSSRGLNEAVRLARFPRDENLLLVVDQFEELFRFKESIKARKGKDEAAILVKLLIEASRSAPSTIYILITMRSDFFGECARFRNLPEAINQCQYLVPRMTRDQIRQAVEGPAAVRRVKMAPRLVQRLLNDVGDSPDRLPILQHVLMRIWSHWSENGTDGPDLANLEAVGGMERALSQHADEVYEGLPDKRSKVIARRFFKSITETGPDNKGMRRPAPVYE